MVCRQGFVDRLSALARASIGFLLFFAIVLPTALVEVKGVVLGFVILLVLIGARHGIFSVAKGVVVACFLFSALGVIWSIWGAANGNPGAARVLTVMAIYPVVFMVLIQVYGNGDGARLSNVFVASAWLVALGDLAFVGSSMYFPGSGVEMLLKHFYADSAVVDYEFGYVKFTLPNVASLLFLLPFLIVGFMENYSSLRGFGVGLLICLCLVVALLSGRRALLVMVVLGPLLAYLLTMRISGLGAISARMLFWRIFGLGSLIGVGLVFYYIYPEYVAELVGSVLDFQDNESNLERVYQFEALVQGVIQAPVFGHGAGAVAGYVRSDEMPWAYELFYLSIVFQYGLVGFFAYSLGVAFLIFYLAEKARRCGRATFEFCYLAGFLSFLLASATNPYIAKFDYMWVLFIPLAVFNSDCIGRLLVSKKVCNGC